MNRLTTLVLAASLVLQGCASTTVNGEEAAMSNAGKVVLSMLVVGALVYAASQANDGPDETWTTVCNDTSCRTSVNR
jgi:hypothetical protein